ncbi:MAG: UbiA family prenyltransferase [Oscillospiraceae bacterium]|nr:UbiA family prenyltransferase [Oscillospiraceae bacterium]
MNKWWVYQKERFPLAGYIPLMATFGFSSLSYSLHLRNADAALSDISIPQMITAIVVTLFWFMLLRIADEHKDFEEDMQFRPYRPVQRGLITLKELRIFGAVLVLLMVALSIWVDLRLLWLLLLGFVWLAFMSLEFGIPKWLKAHPTIYLISHMLIMPFIDLYATAVEWLPSGGVFSFGIVLYMISSFCDGTVVEVGRKLRAPENEEYGVDTYTHIWGAKKAMVVWMICMTISGTSTVVAGFQVNVGFEIMVVLLLHYIIALSSAVKFAKKPTPKNAKAFKILPGIWMILMHTMLGVLPFFK